MGFDSSMPNRGGWRQAPLTSPWPGFELCSDCDGGQLCDWCNGEGGSPGRGRCRDCGGRRWCKVCGGAGQWPLDPERRYFAPAPPMINLRYLAQQRQAQPPVQRGVRVQIGPEGLQAEVLEAINASLAHEGLPHHEEPPELRVARHSVEWLGLGDMADLQQAYFAKRALHDDSMLMSFVMGGISCFLPLDFDSPLEDVKCNWDSIGSAPQLLRELLAIADAFSVRLDPKTGRLAETERERLAAGGPPQPWFSIYEGTELAIAHGTVVCLV